MLSEERILELWTPCCDPYTFARAIEREAYRAGQEKMRERVTAISRTYVACDELHRKLRNIEIEEPK